MRIVSILRTLAACALVLALGNPRSASAQCSDISQPGRLFNQGLDAAAEPNGFEVGQSFTAPNAACYLHSVNLYLTSGSVSGTLRIYQGTSTAAASVRDQAFSLAMPLDGMYSITLSSPVLLTANQTYVFYLDLGAASTSVGSTNANPYAGGVQYFGSGNPATAVPSGAGYDLTFVADLDQNLPVELTTFSATADAGGALLRWETASETNNVGFHVEQQAGQSWQERAFVAGRGTTAERTTYSHTVSGVTPGTYTFRLRQVDSDGTTSYSPTVEVTVGLDGASLVEVRGQTVRFAVREAQSVRAELYNTLGQRLAVLFNAEAQAGQMTTLEVPAGLSAGVYMVRVAGRSFAETARVVVH